MDVEIFKNYSEFLNRPYESINGVTQEFLNDNNLTLDDVNLVDCFGCWNCQNCLNCDYCEYCEYLVDCDFEMESTGCSHYFITSLIKHLN